MAFHIGLEVKPQENLMNLGDRLIEAMEEYAGIRTGAPGIRMVKLTGTSPAGGANNTIAHGLDMAKIISAQVLIENNSGNPIPPNFTSVGSHEFDFFIDADYVHIYCIAANSASIDNGNLVTVLIIYEE